MFKVGDFIIDMDCKKYGIGCIEVVDDVAYYVNWNRSCNYVRFFSISNLRLATKLEIALR